MVVIKLPYLKSTILCDKLAKGMGHNSYGEAAWPNDILYIFPIVIFGITSILYKHSYRHIENRSMFSISL